MTLAPRVLIAAVLVIVPASALAQTWPSLTVSSTPALFQLHTAIGAANFPPQRPARAAPKLNLKTPNSDLAQLRAEPEVEVRAKPEWSDDQGLRVSPTRIAFRSRF